MLSPKNSTERACTIQRKRTFDPAAAATGRFPIGKVGRGRGTADVAREPVHQAAVGGTDMVASGEECTFRS